MPAGILFILKTFYNLFTTTNIERSFNMNDIILNELKLNLDDIEKEIVLPSPLDEVEYRGLGTMNSSIRNVIASRMKDNGTAWSIDL
ncbi:hypothetical protein [Clostridium liquoris]|jgi:hypothetical protein|nr:hypothetical protein [Clostridium liquoris]